MASKRLKGQNTVISILKDGELQARIDSITSTEVTFEMEILTDDFLGDTSERYDTVYNGYSVSIEAQMSNAQIIDLSDSIVNRARNRTGGVSRIDVATTFFFDEGDVRTFSLIDLQFESIPFSSGGRKDFTTVKLSAKGSDYETLS